MGGQAGKQPPPHNLSLVILPYYFQKHFFKGGRGQSVTKSLKSTSLHCQYYKSEGQKNLLRF
jgi:hypothetical protein